MGNDININEDTDFDDFDDFDECLKELERAEAEFDAIYVLIDEGFEWYALLEEIAQHTEEFISQSAQLKKGVLITFVKKDEDLSFLVGNLISGILSLYESFVHNVLNSCLNKNSYVEHALGNLDKLEKGYKRKLRIGQENCDVKKLRDALQSATLNDPEVIRNLSLQLFDLNLPAPDTQIYKRIKEIRNAYTHNGGKLNGQQYKLTGKDFLIVHKIFDDLIGSYGQHILDLVNSFMTNANQNAS